MYDRVELTDDARIACDVASTRHGVSGAIDPKDWIFWFLYNLSVFPTKAAAIDNYFDDGADCARKFRALVEAQRPIAGAQILEFAAGFGRVTRHLQKIAPEASVLACDIHPDAVDFINGTLGTLAATSVGTPEKFDLGRRFDVVFALSFFSHLPRSSWHRWLTALASHTALDGLLIFTVHGERSRVSFSNPAIDADGFWFKPESEQQDLPPDEYGSSITLPSYVIGRVTEMSGMRLLHFQEGFWWGHQDVYVLRRVS